MMYYGRAHLSCTADFLDELFPRPCDGRGIGWAWRRSKLRSITIVNVPRIFTPRPIVECHSFVGGLLCIQPTREKGTYCRSFPLLSDIPRMGIFIASDNALVLVIRVALSPAFGVLSREGVVISYGAYTAGM